MQNRKRARGTGVSRRERFHLWGEERGVKFVGWNFRWVNSFNILPIVLIIRKKKNYTLLRRTYTNLRISFTFSIAALDQWFSIHKHLQRKKKFDSKFLTNPLLISRRKNKRKETKPSSNHPRFIIHFDAEFKFSKTKSRVKGSAFPSFKFQNPGEKKTKELGILESRIGTLTLGVN